MQSRDGARDFDVLPWLYAPTLVFHARSREATFGPLVVRIFVADYAALMKQKFYCLSHHSLRITFGLLFVFAGFTKLADISGFAIRLGDFGIVHDRLVTAAAWCVAVAEVVVGIALIASIRGSLAGAILMLVVFLGVLAYGIGLGLDIDCGCFGASYHVGLRQQFALDCGLVIWCGLIHWSRLKCKLESS